MAYILYNESNKKSLKHPHVGLWFTNSEEEAENMLESCREYMNASGVGEWFKYIKIKEI